VIVADVAAVVVAVVLAVVVVVVDLHADRDGCSRIARVAATLVVVIPVVISVVFPPDHADRIAQLHHVPSSPNLVFLIQVVFDDSVPDPLVGEPQGDPDGPQDHLRQNPEPPPPTVVFPRMPCAVLDVASCQVVDLFDRLVNEVEAHECRGQPDNHVRDRRVLILSNQPHRLISNLSIHDLSELLVELLTG